MLDMYGLKGGCSSPTPARELPTNQKQNGDRTKVAGINNERIDL